MINAGNNTLGFSSLMNHFRQATRATDAKKCDDTRHYRQNDALSDPDEKRIQPRYLAPCLSVQMRCRRLIGWSKCAEQVCCLDINRYGAAIVSPREISEGTELLLNFRGQYISQSDVHARVISQTPYQDGYRLGVQFVYCTHRNHYSRAIDNALSQIEAFCRRHMGRYTRPRR